MKQKRLFAVLMALALCISALAGCGGGAKDTGDATGQKSWDDEGSEGDSEGGSDYDSTVDSAYVGLWTAYALRYSDDSDWEDINFEYYGITSLELMNNGKLVVVKRGEEDGNADSIKWAVKGDGFELAQTGTGNNVGSGEMEGETLIFTYDPNGISTDYKMIRGGEEEALNMIRDDVDADAYFGIWEMTEIRDFNGELLEKDSNLYGDGLILRIDDNGLMGFFSIAALEYKGPDEYEWTVDNGYIYFHDFTGMFKNGVLQVDLGIGTGAFVNNPQALDNVYIPGEDGDGAEDGSEADDAANDGDAANPVSAIGASVADAIGAGDTDPENIAGAVGAGASSEPLGKYTVYKVIDEDNIEYGIEEITAAGFGDIYIEFFIDGSCFMQFEEGSGSNGKYEVNGSAMEIEIEGDKADALIDGNTITLYIAGFTYVLINDSSAGGSVSGDVGSTGSSATDDGVSEKYTIFNFMDSDGTMYSQDKLGEIGLEGVFIDLRGNGNCLLSFDEEEMGTYKIEGSAITITDSRGNDLPGFINENVITIIASSGTTFVFTKG